MGAIDVHDLNVNGHTRDNYVERDAVFQLIRTLLDKGADPNARVKEVPPDRRWLISLGSSRVLNCHIACSETCFPVEPKRATALAPCKPTEPQVARRPLFGFRTGSYAAAFVDISSGLLQAV
jgi:hypothetical protein